MRKWSACIGYCLPELVGREVLIDDAAEIRCGDLVAVTLPHGVIVKRLRQSTDGHWLLQCDEGLALMSPYSVVPSAIARIVEVRPANLPVYEMPAGPGDKELSLHAAFTAGLPLIDGTVPFPGIDAALAAADFLPADFDARFQAALAVNDPPWSPGSGAAYAARCAAVMDVVRCATCK